MLASIIVFNPKKSNSKWEKETKKHAEEKSSIKVIALEGQR
jgi:hypothetical protein